MPDLSLVAILAITIATIFVVYYGIKMTNRRADEAMAGVQRGLPISLSTRWLILFTHAVPLGLFLAGLLAVVSVGLVGLAQGAESPFTRTVGHMSATLLGGGAVFMVFATAMWVFHMRAEFRRSAAG